MKYRWMQIILMAVCLIWLPGADYSESGLVNMLSLHEGAIPVVTPPHYGSWTAENLLDDSNESGWACETGQIANNVFVFEIAQAVTFLHFEFDNVNIDDEGASAKDLLVEVSVTSASSGFSPVLTATLADRAAAQRFKPDADLPARWVRLTLKNNYGSEQWTELFAFRGFATRPEYPVPMQVSGTYESSYSTFHLNQQGTVLTGCYEYSGGLLEGSIEGRVMKLTWRETGEDNTGPVVMVFSDDGRSFKGFWWAQHKAGEAPNGNWDGRKISSEIGSCPHWSGSVGGELKRHLTAEKRARLYGILFDFNSAVIRDQSKPVLDELTALLKTEPEWKLTIEGHTDSIGSDERNLELSRQRAESVKSYLVGSGIDENRLKTAGFGESNPVADNGTELGRAQNRRVELVRE